MRTSKPCKILEVRHSRTGQVWRFFLAESCDVSKTMSFVADSAGYQGLSWTVEDFEARFDVFENEFDLAAAVLDSVDGFDVVASVWCESVEKSIARWGG